MIVALFHRQNDEGYEVLLGRLKVASRTVDEIRGFWKERSVHPLLLHRLPAMVADDALSSRPSSAVSSKSSQPLTCSLLSSACPHCLSPRLLPSRLPSLPIHLFTMQCRH